MGCDVAVGAVIVLVVDMAGKLVGASEEETAYCASYCLLAYLLSKFIQTWQIESVTILRQRRC